MVQRHLANHRKSHKKSAFDYVVYFFMVATPLFELPQAWEIYNSKSAANVSVVTWAFFLVSDFVWLWYGIHNRIKPIIVMYSIYAIVEAAIVVGIIIY